jgi:hypothetical protein
MSPSSEDQEMIHVEEPHDLLDWAIYFSVSREKLKEAVRAVGPGVEDVKRFFGK